MRVRTIVEAVAVAVTIALLLLYTGYGPPGFWGDFRGMTEAEVRANLGEPFRDSRTEGGGRQRFQLAWRQNFATGLFLEFERGTVVAQKRISR